MEITEVFTLLLGIYILFKILNYIYRYPYVSGRGDKYVFITGCDSGFGYETAVRLDKYGMHVLAGCLTEKGESKLKGTCSDKLRTFRLDVSNAENIKEVFEKVKEELPINQGLWGLVNNAGIPGRKMGPFDWLAMEDYHGVMAVNLYGMINMVSVFLPLIRKAKGRIINTTSIVVNFPSAYSMCYGLSKNGSNYFSNAIRKLLNHEGVSVHIIEPQGYNTALSQGLIEKVKAGWQECPPNKKKEYGTDYFNKYLAFCERLIKNLRISENMYEVVDAYEHALLAKHPQPRYAVGWQSKYIFSIFAILPDWITDWILDKFGTIYKHNSTAEKKIN